MGKNFLPENFLLSTPTSEKLYFEFAKGLPIFDFHCHIPPAEIAWIGMDVERGEIPNDEELLEKLVRGVCFENAKLYFGLELALCE